MLLKCLLWCAFTLVAVIRADDLENCKNTKIEENVTLKGGIGAGTFRKMGRVTSMESCIELCCKTHTCDVAFLSGAKCYGVECVSDDECESTATDTSDIKVLISHVRTGAKKENNSLAFALTHAGPASHPDPLINMLGNPNLNKVGATKAAIPPLTDNNSNEILAANAASLGVTAGKQPIIPDLPVAKPLQGLFAPKPALGQVSSGNNSATTALASTGSAAVATGSVPATTKSGMAYADKGEAAPSGAGLPGKCKPGKIYKEVTLRGGINAGTYKDIGTVKDINECSNKCCEFSACDLSFMLQKRCYLVGCSDGKNCQMQKAKPSAFHPTIAYVTRWNSEGVKHTVHVDDEATSNAFCNPMKVLTKVTLKGGLKAGDFTDIGKVGTMGECYNSCCQQPTCNVAFMLGQNCFSVKCYNKNICGTIKAQPSIFNPQIAYVVSRKVIPVAPKPPVNQCPAGKVIENVTLFGGIQAGNFRDHGKVKDMVQCRRICCEMTKCNLAFILAGNCFSVECKTKGLCNTQPAKPSKFSPKISYVRDFGSTELLGAKPATTAESVATPAPKAEILKLTNQLELSLPGQPGQAAKPQAAAEKLVVSATDASTNVLENLLKDESAALSADIKAPAANPQLGTLEQLTQLGLQKQPSFFPSPLPQPPQQQLVSSQLQATDISPSIPPNSIPMAPAPPTALTPGQLDLTANLPGALLQIPPPVQHTPQKNKEHKAEIKKIGLGKQISAASAGQAMSLNFVNGKLKLTPVVGANESSGEGPKETPWSKIPNDLGLTKAGHKEGSGAFDAIFGGEHSEKERCSNGDVIKDVTLKGGKSSGKFDDKGDVKNMDECTDLCCKENACNVAFMLGKTCYTVACKNKELCEHTSAPPSNFKPRLVYVRPFKSNEDEAPAIPPVPKNFKCKHENITNDKQLQGAQDKSNFTLVENVDSMGECMKKCCDSTNCDVAYFVGKNCYSVKCSNKDACKLISSKPNKDSPLLSTMIKAEKELKTDLKFEVVNKKPATIPQRTMFMGQKKECKNSNIVHSTTLQPGIAATNFTSMGSVDSIQSCIGLCCGRPLCDIAYMKDDKCFAVRCLDGMFCQTGSQPAPHGMNVKLAYMNRGGAEKDKDWMIIYIIVGSLAVAAGLGGILWAACICAKRQKLRQKRRLLDDEEDDEMLPKPTQTRYRTPLPRY